MPIFQFPFYYFYVMDYCVSIFNIYIKDNGEHFIYNTIDARLICISEELYHYLKSNEIISSDYFDEELIDLLLKHEIVSIKRHEQLDKLEYLFQTERFSDSFLGLAFSPSMYCNLGCHYCFESKKAKRITEENINAFKSFISIEASKRKHIGMKWTGGEFLMAWDVIRDLSKHIITECEKNDCLYNATAVSNGTLVNEKIVEEMLESRISTIQITFDGGRENHNLIRRYKSGKGTFDVILSNIAILSKFMKVLIRINLDKNNLSSMDELFRTLSTSDINLDNIQLMARPVVKGMSSRPQTELLDEADFNKADQYLVSLARQYQLPYSFYFGLHGVHYRCTYNSTNSYYISPDLKLYKCPLYFDYDDHAVGYISQQGRIIITNYDEYNDCLRYNPFNFAECRQCKVLPICHGKCPVIWELNNRVKDVGCIPDKVSIEEKLHYVLNNDKEWAALLRCGTFDT